MTIVLLLSILLYSSSLAVNPHVEPVMKELMGMRECLPNSVIHTISLWLVQVREHGHHRYLETTALKELSIQLSARNPLCDAMELALRRTINAHRYALAQRESAGTTILVNDGWRETTVRLNKAIATLKSECPTTLSLSKPVPETVQCMKRIEKKSVARLMVHYLGGDS